MIDGFSNGADDIGVDRDSGVGDMVFARDGAACHSATDGDLECSGKRTRSRRGPHLQARRHHPQRHALPARKRTHYQRRGGDAWRGVTAPNLAALSALEGDVAAVGVAVFVYDRRGSGESGGKNVGDYNLLADDAAAAVRMLKADRRIGQRRVGVWGLSQGGWLSLLSASRSPTVDFAISISAPLVSPDVQMMFSSTNSLRVNGYSQADIDEMVATRQAVDDYARGAGDQAEAQRRVDAAKSKPWFKYLYMGTAITERAVAGWRKEMAHDPLRTLDGVRVPALILFGAADPVVPVATSMERLRPRLAERHNLQAAVVARADHDMQIGVDPTILLEPANLDTAAPNAAEYFSLLVHWLTAHRLTR